MMKTSADEKERLSVKNGDKPVATSALFLRAKNTHFVRFSAFLCDKMTKKEEKKAAFLVFMVV